MNPAQRAALALGALLFLLGLWWRTTPATAELFGMSVSCEEYSALGCGAALQRRAAISGFGVIGGLAVATVGVMALGKGSAPREAPPGSRAGGVGGTETRP